MGCVLSQPHQHHHDTSQQYIITSNNKQSTTKQGLRKTKVQTRSPTIQLTTPAPAAVTRQSTPAPLQLRSQPSTTSPTPSIERITPTPSASKHEIAYEYTVEQPETLISTQVNYPRIDLTLIPSNPIHPDHLILPSITPTPTSDIISSPSTMLGMESRRPNLIISTSTSTRDTPTLTRPLSITTTHETTLKLPAINTTTSSSTSTSTSPSLSIATGTSTTSITSTSTPSVTSTFSPPTITTDSPRRIGPLTLQPLSTSTSSSSLSSSRPSLSRPGSADRSARHHHLPPPTPSHFTPHSTVPDTPSFCSPRNAHAKSFFGASASKPPGFSRPSSASSRTTISQRITVTESESSSESEEVEEESSDDEEEEEEEVLDENAPPPVKSSVSSSPASQISLDTDDHDDDPPVFKSVAHLRIDPAAEPCATVIKPPLRRMCRARHVVWDASPEAAHAAYQPPSEILPFLYLGCYDNVYDTPVKSEAKLREMQSLGLSHILTVATECATPYQQFQYLKISIQDDVRSHIHPHFTEAFDFIDQARDRGGKCIVHCWAGVSRSATIVIGYLIARCGMRFDVAHAHVRERRPIVHPNISFREALLNLDACVHEPERYKASQQEVIAMLGDSEAAIMTMDRDVMCGDRKLWGVPIHTLKR